MALVKNDSGRRVTQTFYGLGTFDLEPEQVAELPDAVWQAWQSSRCWGGGQCLLKEVAGDEAAAAGTAVREKAAADKPAPKIYTCSICGMEFTNRYKYGGHKAAHRRDKK